MLSASRTERPQGYSRVFDAWGQIRENDTFTCKHCSRVVDVPPARAGSDVNFDFCRACMAPICLSCAEVAREKGCIPWLKRIENYERQHAERARLFRDIGLIP